MPTSLPPVTRMPTDPSFWKLMNLGSNLPVKTENKFHDLPSAETRLPELSSLDKVPLAVE